MSKTNTQLLAEMAIFAAIAVVLDKFPLFTMPQGGSVSLVMLPLLLLALRRGWKEGVLTGAIVGTIQLFLGGSFLNVFQVFLDYALAYAGIGFAGVFSKSLGTSKTLSQQLTLIALANIIGGGLRFLGNFLSGILFYGEYAPDGIPVWLYSLEYNASYILPSTLICLIVTILLFKARPQFFKL